MSAPTAPRSLSDNKHIFDKAHVSKALRRVFLDQRPTQDAHSIPHCTGGIHMLLGSLALTLGGLLAALGIVL